MKANDKLAEELLKQDGADAENASEKTRKELGLMIARDKAHLKRLKWIAIVSWALVVLSSVVLFFTAAVASSGLGWSWVNVLTFSLALRKGVEVVLFYVIVLVAVVSTVLCLLTSRSLTLRQLRARLANIEEQLQQLSPNP